MTGADRLLNIGQFARASGLTANALRHYALELPVAEVRRLLDLYKDDADALTAELLVHRKRLESRAVRLQRQLHDLDHLVIEKGWQHMGEAKDQLVLEPDVQRQIAAACFNRVWTLLEKETRTEAEDAQMIHAAHASTYHWMQIGEPVRRARGEWQCSRVYCVLGHPEAAMFHTDEAHRWAELARSAATDIADEFDRELLLGDLETLPVRA